MGICDWVFVVEGFGEIGEEGEVKLGGIEVGLS